MRRFIEDFLAIVVGAFFGWAAYHSTRDLWLAVFTASAVSHGMTCFRYVRRKFT